MFKININNKLALFLLILLFASVAFFSLFSGYERIWNIWSIPVCPPHFTDVDMMTMGAESHALGYDPLYDNPVHPWNKKLNYPRIWHILFALDIDRSHNDLIGSVFVILFFTGLGIFMFSKRYSNLTVLIISLLVLSPSIMLGIERGNIELVIFLILALALLINHYSTIAALFLFFLAAVLKIYPAFAFVYLLKENKKKFWTLFLSASGIFILYLLFTLTDLQQIFLTTPKIAKSSYGLNVLWMGLTHPRILNLQLSDNVIMTARIFSYVLLVVVFIGAIHLSLKTHNDGRFKQGQHLDAFRVGAIIYIGCFVIGNNFDYRFTFLIFTIPQLVSWLHTKDNKYSKVPLITLLAIVFSCWNYVVKRFIGMKAGFVLEEISNWIVLSGLLYLFLSSAPAWFNDYLRLPLNKSKRKPGIS